MLVLVLFSFVMSIVIVMCSYIFHSIEHQISVSLSGHLVLISFSFRSSSFLILSRFRSCFVDVSFPFRVPFTFHPLFTLNLHASHIDPILFSCCSESSVLKIGDCVLHSWRSSCFSVHCIHDSPFIRPGYRAGVHCTVSKRIDLGRKDIDGFPLS